MRSRVGVPARKLAVVRRILRPLLSAAVVATSFGAAACDSFLDGAEQLSYIFPVDSVTGPTAFPGAAPATVFVWARVATNDCNRFVGFDTTRTSVEQVDVLAIGQYTRRGRQECVTGTVELRGQPLTIAPPITSPLRIVFRQPGGGTLTRTVYGE